MVRRFDQAPMPKFWREQDGGHRQELSIENFNLDDENAVDVPLYIESIIASGQAQAKIPGLEQDFINVMYESQREIGELLSTLSNLPSGEKHKPEKINFYRSRIQNIVIKEVFRFFKNRQLAIGATIAGVRKIMAGNENLVDSYFTKERITGIISTLRAIDRSIKEAQWENVKKLNIALCDALDAENAVDYMVLKEKDEESLDLELVQVKSSVHYGSEESIMARHNKLSDKLSTEIPDLNRGPEFQNKMHQATNNLRAIFQEPEFQKEWRVSQENSIQKVIWYLIRKHTQNDQLNVDEFSVYASIFAYLRETKNLDKFMETASIEEAPPDFTEFIWSLANSELVNKLLTQQRYRLYSRTYTEKQGSGEITSRMSPSLSLNKTVFGRFNFDYSQLKNLLTR